jgi:hypothetical protein
MSDSYTQPVTARETLTEPTAEAEGKGNYFKASFRSIEYHFVL